MVWNNSNCYGSGIRGSYGLTDKGRNFLEKAIDLGISLDLSHMNKNTFYDSIQFIKEQKSLGKTVKVLASHSNCYEICRNDRNLDDDQLRALKSVDGLLGIVSYSVFVRDKNSVENLRQLYLKHINHAVSILGIDSVCLSSDDMDFLLFFFQKDMGEVLFDYEHIAFDIHELLKENYCEADIRKIMYQNIYNKLFKEELL